MNTQSKVRLWNVAICLVLGLSVSSSHAFSLLGPYESWMTPTNGFQLVGDIGGPMNLGAEYRWNVPVVTYGFDQSFLDYFGTNGVAAVESAIQILNELPPASQIVLTNYPFESRNLNYAAQAQSLFDLKSETLSLLLEQMGLTSPTRYIYVLRQWNPVLTDPANEELYFSVFEGTNISDYVVARNYDPQELTASPYVNDTLYSGFIETFPDQSHYIVQFSVDALADAYSAVADGDLVAGTFYQGLTCDDVGGLRYLLETNNYNFETLLPDVQGAGTNANNYVNFALRGGVDKITFVQETVDPLLGEFFSPVTNQYTDTYVTNNVLMQQQLERVTTRPDFLFCAADFGNSNTSSVELSSSTGTSNWINNAASNGNPGGAGPGVIQPQVRITFNKVGCRFFTSGNNSDEVAYDESRLFGSFDGSTNAPISYPVAQPGFGQLSVYMCLEMGQASNGFARGFHWEPASSTGAAFAMQTSTNLTDWRTLFTVTNNGSVITYIVNNPASPGRFYRLVPQ